MPDFKKPEPPRLPETKYNISAVELIKAVKGLPFNGSDALLRLKGKEIKQKKLFPEAGFELDDMQDYVIVHSATINDVKNIDFLNTEMTNYHTGLIFYKSIVPGIKLQNAVIGNWRLFNSFVGGDIIIGKNSTSGKIWIRSNSLCEVINISSNSQSEAISISSNSQSGAINISSNSQNGAISISSNSQSKDINISSNSQNGAISISSNSQSGDININSSSQSGDISISSNSQSGAINISSNSQSEYIWIRENSQTGVIWIRENSQTGLVEVSDSTCPNLIISDNYVILKLFNSSIQLMELNNCYISELIWQAGTRGELYISDSKINYLNLFHTSLVKDALLSITDTQLFIAEMNKLTVQGQLLLTNIKHLEKPFTWEPFLKKHLTEKKPGDDANHLIKSIYQSKINLLTKQEENYNKEKEKLQKEVSEIPLWLMANSSLGKTEITGSDLTGFVFKYRDSKLLDTFISGTKLHKEKIEIYNPNLTVELSKIVEYEQKISIYSQLKRIFENQGNIVEATWYHSKAMENQQWLLQENYNNKAKKKWFSEEEFELFNIKLNKLSNNHGESWRKAFYFVLLSSFVVYALYFLSINCKKEFSFSGIGYFIGRFFSFLNITRREDFMVNKDELNVFSYFFDYFGRVVTSFGIYQLIAAFRRHGRK